MDSLFVNTHALTAPGVEISVPATAAEAATEAQAPTQWQPSGRRAPLP